QSMKTLMEQTNRVADSPLSVLIFGESGTGKESIARYIHEHSARRSGPFFAVDCGTLSRELAGSELFGHTMGAFTGAVSRKEGLLELANGGTFFLDEVGNLALDVQSVL